MSIRLSEIISKKLNISSLSNTKLRVLSLAHAKLFIDTLTLRATAKNRILPEIITLPDYTYLAVLKQLAEESDTGIITDLAQLNIEQVKLDTVSTSDIVTITTHFYRTITDAVIMNDHTILNFTYGRAPQDAADINDAHSWAVVKALVDNAGIADNTFANIEQLKTDIVSTTDIATINAMYHRVFTDNLNVYDTSSLAKNLESKRNDLAVISDESFLSINTVYAESIFLEEIEKFVISKVLTESIGVSDNIVFHFPNNLKPVFNAVTFNSSAFG